MSVTHGSSVRRYGQLINGSSGPIGGPTIDRRNPATGRLVAKFSGGTARDADQAVAAARSAFDGGPWPRLRGIERGEVLRAWARGVSDMTDALVEIEIEEGGKPIRLARYDIADTVELIEYAASLAPSVHGEAYNNLGETDLGLVVKEPVGVVAAILPWNFPSLIYAQKVPFALAAGCTVIVKPSEFTAGTAVELTRLAHAAGVPANALNVVTGYGGVVGQALAESGGVDMISFTGSTRTGRTIATAPSANLKRLSFELGGKGATIVFDDADLDDAIDGALFGAYLNQGQTCCAGSRLLVQDTIADAFVERLAATAGKLRTGDLYNDATDLGALIHPAQLDKVMRYLEVGLASDASLVCGGRRLDDQEHRDGLFVAPTLFDQVGADDVIFREEIFGPVLTTTRFSTVPEAIALSNATPYGLADSVWTKDVDRAVTVARALRTGTVWINSATDGAPQLPFGGYKDSGFGREKGVAGLDEFTESKTIHVKLGKREPFFYNVAAPALE